MNYHLYFNNAHKPVETCVIGTGGFGRSFLAQGLRVPLMKSRVAVDLDVERVVAAMRDVGIPADQIRICATAAEARQAWDEGLYIAATDYAILTGLPIDVLVEATGQPEAGARHGRLALEAGHHIALVSKEVDSVVGPGLAAFAAQNGKTVTPVDGDQPSLLIDLITWAEVLGFEIIAAGKSSEYDFIWDADKGTLYSNGITITAPEFGDYDRLGDRDCLETIKGRSQAASALPQRAVPDLCELSVVANATGMMPDVAQLHAPIARITEVPTILCEKKDGGILSGKGRLDVFHCLRNPGEVSFAGGVFVIIRCEDAVTWKLLEEKGHILSRNGKVAMVYLPRHLLGLEAATSVLSAGIHNVSTGGMTPAHHVDLVAHADRDFAAGEILTMGGHHHSIEGVSARIIAGSALSEDSPAPFYIASNQKLKRPLKAGSLILMGDLEHVTNAELKSLREKQDRHFYTN